ncbi:hypothetical protein GCM10010995_10960 [Cysteiniphilum litorale]|uniref:Protein Smg homolog n=2 Tax=Fastidiosibacteraceae TaxID=2056687 RepID=A0A8J2Z487_9GAMM|nr:DUF494 family protein [Cysteiniphilum litorale]GGF95532.1 hypothetical protein GCM10010995_10960 [Cysteiniphilum litorale]
MNNKAPILQVLMSLFSDLPYFDGDMVKLTNSQEILHELQKAGLAPQAIEQAIAWLERFSKFNDEPRADYHPETVRVFTPQEKAIIPTESLRFLLEAYLAGDIQSHELEFIIEQIISLGTHTITEEQFLWIFEMTIANQEDELFGGFIPIEEVLTRSFRIH